MLSGRLTCKLNNKATAFSHVAAKCFKNHSPDPQLTTVPNPAPPILSLRQFQILPLLSSAYDSSKSCPSDPQLTTVQNPVAYFETLWSGIHR
jgi:hypothetical protein